MDKSLYDKINQKSDLDKNLYSVGTLLSNINFKIDIYQRYLATDKAWQLNFLSNIENQLNYISIKKSNRNNQLECCPKTSKSSSLQANNSKAKYSPKAKQMLGFIILYPEKGAENVVDGHNRLETLSLIIAVWQKFAIKTAKNIQRAINNKHVSNTDRLKPYEKLLQQYIKASKTMLFHRNNKNNELVASVALPSVSKNKSKRAILYKSYNNVIDGSDIYPQKRHDNANFQAQDRLNESITVISNKIHSLCSSSINNQQKLRLLSKFFWAVTRGLLLRPFVIEKNNNVDARKRAINLYININGNSCSADIQSQIKACIYKTSNSISRKSNVRRWTDFVDRMNDNSSDIAKLLMYCLYSSKSYTGVSQSNVVRYVENILKGSHRGNNKPASLAEPFKKSQSNQKNSNDNDNVKCFLDHICQMAYVHNFCYEPTLHKKNNIYEFINRDPFYKKNNIVNQTYDFKLRICLSRIKGIQKTVLPIFYGIYHQQQRIHKSLLKYALSVAQNILRLSEIDALNHEGTSHRMHYGEPSGSYTYGSKKIYTPMVSAWWLSPSKQSVKQISYRITNENSINSDTKNLKDKISNYLCHDAEKDVTKILVKTYYEHSLCQDLRKNNMPCSCIPLIARYFQEPILSSTDLKANINLANLITRDSRKYKVQLKSWKSWAYKFNDHILISALRPQKLTNHELRGSQIDLSQINSHLVIRDSGKEPYIQFNSSSKYAKYNDIFAYMCIKYGSNNFKLAHIMQNDFKSIKGNSGRAFEVFVGWLAKECRPNATCIVTQISGDHGADAFIIDKKNHDYIAYQDKDYNRDNYQFHKMTHELYDWLNCDHIKKGHVTIKENVNYKFIGRVISAGSIEQRASRAFKNKLDGLRQFDHTNNGYKGINDIEHKLQSLKYDWVNSKDA